MSAEGQVPNPPAPAAAVVPPPADGATPPPAPAAAPVAPAAPAENPNQALLDRIDRLTREKHDRDREIENLRRAAPPAAPPVSPPSAGTPPAAPPAPTFDAAEVERRAEELARQRLEAQSFQQVVGSIADAGLKAFPTEWAQGVANLQRINALDPDSIQAIHELGDSHLIVHALAKDLNEAARIASLPPAARGVAYARLADKVKASAAQQISQAPPPAGTEVGGNAPMGSGPNDRQSMDEWAASRKKSSSRWGGGR